MMIMSHCLIHACRFNLLFFKRFWCILLVAVPKVLSVSMLLLVLLVLIRAAGLFVAAAAKLNSFSESPVIVTNFTFTPPPI